MPRLQYGLSSTVIFSQPEQGFSTRGPFLARLSVKKKLEYHSGFREYFFVLFSIRSKWLKKQTKGIQYTWNLKAKKIQKILQLTFDFSIRITKLCAFWHCEIDWHLFSTAVPRRFEVLCVLWDLSGPLTYVVPGFSTSDLRLSKYKEHIHNERFWSRLNVSRVWNEKLGVPICGCRKVKVRDFKENRKIIDDL